MVMSNVSANFSAGDHPYLERDTEEFSQETGLCVAVIHIPKRSFVIGSHGLTIVEDSYKGGLAAGSWLPIAYDVMVSATSYSDREFLIQIDSSNDWMIGEINMATFQQSRIIAGCSEELVRSLVGM